MDIGRKIIVKYLYLLKISDKDFADKSYSKWYDLKISSNNSLVNKIESDQIKAYLGFCLIQILESCNMVKSELVIKSKDEKYYVLRVDRKILNMSDKSILDFPLKLPMIVKPKPYNHNILGGYLLNDVNYREEFIIHKNIIKHKSIVKDDNIIYDMVNNISCVPYKINKELLEYILINKHGLLIDSDAPIIYENIEKINKYQQTKYSSYLSKLNLQETILGLADFYQNFSKIYFPLRMDNRGRIYCSNSYLNYQSS